jgi:hypothetical protein
MDNNWLFVLIPRTSNVIVPIILKFNKHLRELGWVSKYMDYTFVGTASSDNPLKNMLNKDRLLTAIEYAMRKSIRREEEIPFKVVEKISPMVAEVGMGLIIESTFLRHLASAFGFTASDMFFMVLATPSPGCTWSEEEIRTGIRIFEDPDDGKFHCNMHPSQWNVAVFNKANPEIIQAIIDLESIVPPLYTKIEIERLSKSPEIIDHVQKMAKETTNNLKTQTTGNEPSETQTTGNEPSETQTTGNEPSETQTTGNEPSETQTTGNEPSETQTTGNEPSETQTTGNEPSETQTTGNE